MCTVLSVHTGNWVRKVVDDMKTKKENSKEDIKLYLYSAVRM